MNKIGYFQTYIDLKYLYALCVLLSLIVFGYIYREILPYNFEFTYLLLLLFSAYVLFKVDTKIHLSKSIWIWFFLLAFYWSINLWSVLYHGSYDKRSLFVLGVASSIFIFIALYLLLIKLRPSIDFFWYFIGLTAFVLSTLLVIELISADFDLTKRIGNHYYHPLRFGVFSSTIMIILMGSYWWASKKSYLVLFVYIMLTVFLFMATFLSQTRTGWLGLPEALILWGGFYIYIFRRQIVKIDKKVLISIILLLGMIIFSVGSHFYEGVSKRVGLAISDVEQYYKSDDFNTSVGLRLMMYEVSINGIQENVWAGIGEHEFEEYLKIESAKLVKERFNEEYDGGSFSNAHNQFLMSWLTKGVFGFLSILFLFLFLFIYFARGIKLASDEAKPVWIAGLAFTIAVFLYGFTQTPFQKSLPFTHIMLHLTYLIAFTQLLNNDKQD